ncbi:stage V sporulation protein AE [Paraclostridium sordellii]|uniref:stage V sporulation protein AE n=1 Tax=Paraclostridium sordellii TaxID=1505 RepID=UPI0005DEBB09|nr:stage V sporulation protein AE [Paeniclostridium sordellii]CEP82120.1 stage V sporulation protein AE [[Clostridium] sordellii] [Paeniclostridium sordellii]
MIDYLKVFLVGGVICLIAQIMMDYFKLQTPYIMVTYVTGGVLLSFIGIYDKIVGFGGAGATVPIIGFGYSLYNGVVKAVEQDGFIGIFTGGITATAGGIAAAIFFGYIMAVVFTPKAKP